MFLEDCKNADFWEQLPKSIKEELVNTADKIIQKAYPSLPVSMFMQFKRIGNRVNYENFYFLRRTMLNTFVLAECTKQSGKYLDRIIDGVFTICEESTWQLPAHNRNILPDCINPDLDLFACETGALLAMTDYLLSEQFNQISETIHQRIQFELEQRIFVPYRERYFSWMGDGTNKTSNWTIWCTQNVLIANFLSNGSTFQKEQITKKAIKSIQYFLNDYGEDGCCDEGAQYYRHAGLCLFNSIELLIHFYDSTMVEYYQKSKIRNIASYILHMYVGNGYYFNFSDCSCRAGFATAREYLFAKRTNQLDMMQYAIQEIQANSDRLLPDEINLFYRVQNLSVINEIMMQSQFDYTKTNIFYPSVGIWIAHDWIYDIAVKAGNNGDNHNHNDVGSFTVYKCKQPLFIDIGVGTYTKQTFSKQRYALWPMQSAYHNLPTIDHLQQSPGKEYAAKDITYEFSNPISWIQMDISKAYPSDCNISFYQRKVVFVIGKGIQLMDSYASCTSNTPHDVILSLMVYEPPVSSSSHTLNIGSLGSIEFHDYELLAIEEIPITDDRLAIAWKHSVYRIQLRMLSEHAELIIT